MLSLDSPRWAKLRTAYGSARDVPRWIRALADVADCRTPPGRGGAVDELWIQVYHSLLHHLSTYSATFAALPHLAAGATKGALRYRVETLDLVGNVRLQVEIRGGWSKLSPEARHDLAEAVRLVRPWSRDVARKAATQRGYRRDGSVLHYLQCFAALRHPEAACVQVLDGLDAGEVGVKCPNCEHYIYRDVVADPLPIEAPADAAKRMKRARAALRARDPIWPNTSTASLLAALSVEWRAPELCAALLALDGRARCEGCGKRFPLAVGLQGA